MSNLRHLGQSVLMVGLSLLVACGRSDEPEKAPPTEIKADSAAISSVTAQPASPQQLEAALRERIQRYWTARQVRDVRTLYELESAAQPGGWLKLENAMSLMGLPVRNVNIQELRIDGERAITKLSGEVVIGTFGWTPQSIEDAWVLIDGQWFHETIR